MNTFRRPFLVVVLALLAPSVAFAVKVQFNSDPAGATVQIVGPAEAVKKLRVASGVTPVVIDLPRNTIPFEVTFSKPGYESVQLLLNTKTSQALTANLPQLVDERVLELRSTPAGAEVVVNGASAGVTPLSRPFRFERAGSRDAWSAFEVVFRKADYQEEKVSLTRDRATASKTGLAQDLGRIADTREIDIVAVDSQGNAIPKAEVLVNGKSVARTSDRGVARISLPFARPTRTAAWSQFEVTALIADEYTPVKKTLVLEGAARVEFQLSPVTEVAVKRYFPGTEMTSRGPRLRIDQTTTNGILNTQDINTAGTELRLVTNYPRRQTTLQAVNSFTVTPDGRNIIFGATGVTDDGKYFSNLYLKAVQSTNSPVSQLTRGTRYLDSAPAMSGEEGGSLVVFQSTRGVPETWDISAIRLNGTQLVGGVQQLTRDSRFIFGPSIASEQQPVFFCCMDDAPQADARISSVPIGSATLTSYNESGEALCASATGHLYFVRPDDQTKKRQIAALKVDDQMFSTVINEEQFAKANCDFPAISPSGDMLLFCADADADEQGRKNNNVYLANLKTGGITQLTDNGSDDIMPHWSPTEPGVIFFLSNRGGIYNVWRMSFRLGQ